MSTADRPDPARTGNLQPDDLRPVEQTDFTQPPYRGIHREESRPQHPRETRREEPGRGNIAAA